MPTELDYHRAERRFNRALGLAAGCALAAVGCLILIYCLLF
ncbi:hypothetical protein [Hymenobacter sp. B81]